MKIRITYFITGIFLIITSSFVGKKTTQVESDYFVFGLFYGECEGADCIQMYKLDKKNLYKDVKSHYPTFSSYYSGTFKKLGNDKFQRIYKITSRIPQELLNSKSGIIGEPDAGDWGGFYFEYSNKGKKKYWIIDKNKNNLSKYLHNFVDDVENTIKQINK